MPSVPAKKKSLGSFVRIGVSLVLAGLVYYTVDRRGVLNALGSVSWRGATTLIILYIMGQVLSAMKWRIFVEQVGIRRSPFGILRAYFLGMFVNVFGFGTVGGDVARALTIIPAKGQRAGALATVIADRVHGLMVLLSIGTIAILVVRPEQLGNLTPLLGIGGALGVVALFAGWWIGPAILEKFFSKNEKLSKLAFALSKAFPRKPKPFLTATFISVIFHCVQLLMHIVIAHELKAPISAPYILATVPFVNIVASLPVSVLNGLGVREAMYRYLFIPAGVPQEIAVAFGTIWLLVVTLVSSVGVLMLTPGTKEIIERAEVEEPSLDTPSVPSSQPASARRAVG